MKANLIALLAVFALTLAPACARHMPLNLTPQAQAAYKADQVAQRIGELQDTAIALNRATPQVLTDKDAVTVVTFTVSALKTIKAAPDGWQATVLAAYTQLKAALPPNTRTSLATVFSTVDAVLATFAPPPPPVK
jgi:hypothetical protein